MYHVIRSMIAAGGYKLTDIQYKIDRMYVMGRITEEQVEELMGYASEGATPDSERPEMLTMLQTLFEKFEALEIRVKNLEEKSANEIPGSDENVDPIDPEVPVYAAWEHWNGIDNRYQPGAIVTHNDKVWESVYNGQNVWEPGVVGSNFWKEVEAEI